MPDSYIRTETEHGDTLHNIKVWPLFWEAVADGHKRFELVINDRNYHPGDKLGMYEFVPLSLIHI